MATKMCEFNRRTIEHSLGAIYAIVAEPKFICRSCARVAGSEQNLCKPSAIPPKACLDKVDTPQSDTATETCALLLEAKATRQLPELSFNDAARAKQSVADTDEQHQLHEKHLKKQRKMLKKQKKMYKKLSKIVRKEQKLLKKRSELDAHLSEMVEAASLHATSKHLH
ncbi:hypothetical protein [Vibrio rarus]|uniref:hypothetical protein n=1 Tax=Vibrio rarus TaxID=413403 RepID=UPI0021C2F6BE|nr:hypothetical protein [Vibrio rarus]